ncbi:MAG: ParD-like family protein [Candidatus Caenarcaniphilales bacterium]|nr:ParD-like family protein [Candidatus Caenarcaniphilales bacterium]
MAKAVKISDSIFNEAKAHASANMRSVAKQIEFWAKIGKISEENPDLSYKFIREILISIEQEKNNELSEYNFGT